MKNQAGRPKGSCKPKSERRVNCSVRVKPATYEQLKTLPKGTVRTLLETLYPCRKTTTPWQQLNKNNKYIKKIP